MIKTFKIFLEKVQDDFFEKHPDFFLSKTKDTIEEYKKKYNINQGKKYESPLKNVDIKDIELFIDYDEGKLVVKKPIELNITLYREYNGLKIFNNINDPYFYKIIKVLLDKYKLNSLVVDGINISMINELFKTVDYYALVYIGSFGYKNILLTKDRDEIKDKIRELKKYGDKIISFYNKSKGKQLTDYERIALTKIKNTLKNIDYNEIDFRISERNPHKDYDVIIDKSIIKDNYNLTGFRNFFSRETIGGDYFGKLNNRFHIGHGLNSELKGIGLGYKIYKAFIKYQGYIVTGTSTSDMARNVYYKLLQDDDLLYIIDKKNQRLMLIWKNYDKLDKLVRIARENEKRKNLNYIYDKEI